MAHRFTRIAPQVATEVGITRKSVRLPVVHAILGRVGGSGCRPHAERVAAAGAMVAAMAGTLASRLRRNSFESVLVEHFPFGTLPPHLFLGYAGAAVWQVRRRNVVNP